MDDETLTSLRYCFQRILVPTIVVVGLLGNFVTVIVLTRRRMRCSTNVYLFFLAVVDMVFLLFNFILSIKHYPHLKRSKYELYWRLYGIFIWLVDGSSYSSIYLTVSFTIERYIAVCHPIRGQAMCTESRAKKVIAVVIIMCFLLTSITPFEYMLKPEEHYLDSRTGLPCSLNESLAIEVNLTATTTTPLSVVRDYDEIAFGLDQWKLADADFRNATERNNIAGTEPESIYCVKEVFFFVGQSELGQNETYLTVVSYTTAVLFTFLPLMLLATFNCFLVAAVHNSTKLRRDMTHSRKSQAAAVQENKMTVTLIAVVLLFLCCQTPTAIFLLYCTFMGEPPTKRDMNLRLAIGNILNCLVIINAACNFILYCALSAKYRQTVKDIIFRRGRMKRQNTTHTRLSRYVSGTDGTIRGGGGLEGGWPSRSSRTPSFQADVRPKLNPSSRTPSFHRANLGVAKPTTGGAGGQASGDRNRTSSISEKRLSINAQALGAGNSLTQSNRDEEDDVNRQFYSGGCSLPVPQLTPTPPGRRAETSSTTAKKKDDSVKRTKQHLLRNSHSSASLTRSQSLVLPEQTKHSPSCKSHPMNK